MVAQRHEDHEGDDFIRARARAVEHERSIPHGLGVIPE